MRPMYFPCLKARSNAQVKHSSREHLTCHKFVQEPKTSDEAYTYLSSRTCELALRRYRKVAFARTIVTLHAWYSEYQHMTNTG